MICQEWKKSQATFNVNTIEGLANLPQHLANLASEPFVIMNTPHEEGRILMFVSKPGLEFMETCPTWPGDGTFRTSTKFFAQVYFIMAQSSNDNSKFVLVVFCLLPNKRASTYEIVFESLKRCVKKGPETFLIDFEIGVKTQFETSFPGTVVRGCYFHLVYNILKHVKKKGGQVELRQNIRFSIAISHVKALAFLPSDQVNAAYENIVRPMLLGSVANKEMAISVCNYLEHTYMGKRRTRTTTTAPLFSPSMWSNHQTVLGDGVRVLTNNSQECFNRVWNNTLAKSPNVGSVIAGFQREAWLMSDTLREVRTYCPDNHNAERKKQNVRYNQISKILQRLNGGNTPVILGDIARLI